MKKFNVLLTATLLATAAHAQVSAPPTPGAAPALVTKSLAAAGVNPFLGKALSVEELQSELEASRIHTSTLEERLKQTSLTSEIATVPLRKAAEAAQARTAFRVEELKLEAVERASREAAVATEAAAEAAAKAAAKAAKAAKAAGAEERRTRATSTNPTKLNQASASQPGADNVLVVSPPPRPTLLSVLTVGASKTAVLDFGGNTLMVQDGGMTPIGPIRILNDRSVALSDVTLQVSTMTLSRFTQEKAPVAAAKGGASYTPLETNVLNARVGGGTGNVSAGPGTAVSTGEGVSARLPPLQLPPGMTILP